MMVCIAYIAKSSHLNHPTFADVFLSSICVLQLYLIVFEFRLMKALSNLPNVYLGAPYFGGFLDIIPPKSFYEATLYWKKKALCSDTDIISNNEPFTVQIRGKPLVVLSSDKDVAFLNNIERKGHTNVAFPRPVTRLMGETSILRVEGKHHRVLRRIMEPIFAPSNLESYVKTIDNIIVTSIKEWTLEETWQPNKVFKILTLRLLLCVIFDDITDEIVWKFHDLLKIWLSGFASAHAYSIPGTVFYKAMQAKAKMENMIGELITNFKQKYSSSERESEKLKSSFLGRLVYGTDENGKSLTDLELKENILLILFAGHDTTYVSMGTFLHYLTKLQPNVHNALLEEVHNIKEPLASNDLRNNAPILNAFIAETWRIMPPVVSFGRINVSNNTFRHKNHVFPKGCVFVVPTHFNKEEYYGKSGHDFHIERWLPDDHPLKLTSSTFSKSNDNLAVKDYNQISRAFNTFGVGNHSCLGHNLAKLEARIILARMLRYDIKVRGGALRKRPFIHWTNEFQLSAKKCDD